MKIELIMTICIHFAGILKGYLPITSKKKQIEANRSNYKSTKHYKWGDEHKCLRFLH